MSAGIPILSEKGREAIANKQINISARCRSVLVQIDGKRSLDDIRSQLRGLDGLEEAIGKLIDEGYILSAYDCKSLVKNVAEKQLGAKAGTILRKIDEMHAKYGEACWDHLEEIDKAARLFYGETIAVNLKNEIAKIVQGMKK
ncbi:MAG: hypothetical protein M0042_01830 [Nitrospiraceae bacterium]|nr:hypothetical protein [Nitrospiraceae bacterium]